LYETAITSGDCILALTELSRPPSSQAHFTTNRIFHPPSTTSILSIHPISDIPCSVSCRATPLTALPHASGVYHLDHLHTRDQYNSPPRCHSKYLCPFPQRCNLYITVFYRVSVHPHYMYTKLRHKSTVSCLQGIIDIIKRHKYNHLFIYLMNAIHTMFSTPRHVNFIMRFD
jgi:hypothetical protein